MKHAHLRHACSGGSAARPDPLVIEIAESDDSNSSPSPPREALASLLARDPAEVETSVQIDDKLLVEAGESIAASGEYPDERHDASSDAWLRKLMAGVQLPTLRALSTASLEPLRLAIGRTNEEEDRLRWAVYHTLLGSALKLRSERTRGSMRAKLLIEASRAFDVAYSVYAVTKASSNSRDAAVAGVTDLSEGLELNCHRPFGRCVGDRDGTSLIARVISSPGGENTEVLLERAITCLRLVRAGADVRSWTWVSSTNNLACALTLLGNRISARAGSAMLEEAARVLSEALRAHAAGHRREDRGSTLVNLAEALLSMAEREMPGMRVQQVEKAFMASAAALQTVVPREMLWLVVSRRRDLE